jgi:PAS domain S-box-containing protein
MPKTPKIQKQNTDASKFFGSAGNDDRLVHLAFDKTARANIISIVSNGKIIMANSAACKLLGYSKKKLLTKSRADIFDITESSFKKMLKQRMVAKQSEALVTVFNKQGKPVHCLISSAVFMDTDGIEKSITTIADMTQSVLDQKNIDAKKEQAVTDNITVAKSKQKEIDIKKEKAVADNIVLARSKQKRIDIKKEKVVADNILTALTKSDERLAENNEWIKYIAKTSYDVMWDWDIATNEIYVGDSIEEVFGYNVKNNTVHYMDFCRCLLPEEKNTVEKKLWKTLAGGNKSWNDSFRFIRKDGTEASTISRAYIVRDEEGKAVRLIGAVQDISRVHEMEKKLQAEITKQGKSREMFFLVAKISSDVIWDRNLLTNEVIRGEGFEELLGYPLKDYKGQVTDWSDHIHPADKIAVEKGLQDAIASSALHWEHAFRIIRADGSIAKVFDRARIFRQPNGKAFRMIGAMQDLSRQEELEEKLENEFIVKEKLVIENNERFKLIFNSSSDVLYDNDLVTGNVIISDAYEKEYGYKITGNMTPAADWISHIHPDDKEEVYERYLQMLDSNVNQWNYSYRFLRADGSVVNVISNAVIIRHSDGKAYRVIGSMQDLSRQSGLGEKLEEVIRLREKQIAEATADAKDTERSDIGKELHDNVNQLLGASRMCIDMAKRGGADSEMYLNRSSEYTLNAIEEIRKLTQGLTTDTIKNLGLCEAIENITRDTMEVNPVKISFAFEDFTESNLNDKFKLNVYRIVQEQLNNILKHAKATEVHIRLSQNKKTILLSMSDNGVGFDPGKKQKGIGVANIKSRASAYNGTAEFISKPGEGCVLIITLPVLDALLDKR